MGFVCSIADGFSGELSAIACEVWFAVNCLAARGRPGRLAITPLFRHFSYVGRLLNDVITS